MPTSGKRHVDAKLVLTVACGATIELAARQVGVSESTVYRRLKDPAFRQQVEEARSEMVKRTMSMLTAAGLESVKTLLDLQKPAVGAATRLGSARAVLELGSKMRESVAFEERLSALEERMVDNQPAKSSRKR